MWFKSREKVHDVFLPNHATLPYSKQYYHRSRKNHAGPPFGTCTQFLKNLGYARLIRYFRGFKLLQGRFIATHSHLREAELKFHRLLSVYFSVYARVTYSSRYWNELPSNLKILVWIMECSKTAFFKCIRLRFRYSISLEHSTNFRNPQLCCYSKCDIQIRICISFHAMFLSSGPFDWFSLEFEYCFSNIRKFRFPFFLEKQLSRNRVLQMYTNSKGA